MKQRSFLILIIFLLLLAFGISAIARAQESTPDNGNAPAGTAFTYQGQLKDASGPVTDSCDFQFSLWDTLTNGAQVGSTLTRSGIVVSDGLFTVQLDFGANAFNGSARWLETAVRCPAGSGSYTTLTPRQPLSPAPYALYSANADLLDGQHAAAFQQHYQNLVVVAKSGGNYTTITEALDSITTNSAANPFTIYIAPGVYTETITMKPYVDIEGAGEQATKITFTSNSTITSTVTGADNTELRFLTVENTGGGSDAIAILNSSASPGLTHVTANASGGTNNYGVHNHLSSPTMSNMTITTSGGVNSNNYSVYNTSSSSPKMTNITITTSGGVSNYSVDNTLSSSPTMTNVSANTSGGEYNIGVSNSLSSPIMTNVSVTTSGEVDSTNYGVFNRDSSAPVMTSVIASASSGRENYGVCNYVATPTMSYVTATASGGLFSMGVYNNSSTLKMTNVIATASDATYATGVYNLSASVLMTNITANASNGTDSNWGVYNRDSSQPMLNVTASASGGTNSYSVYNDTSSPAMTNLIATASGASNNYGMWNTNSSPTIQNSVISASSGNLNDGIHNYASSGSYTVKISNSQITGSTSTIYQVDNYYTTQVGASQVNGAGAFGGTYICVASYNGSYAALDSSCQP